MCRWQDEITIEHIRKLRRIQGMWATTTDHQERIKIDLLFVSTPTSDRWDHPAKGCGWIDIRWDCDSQTGEFHLLGRLQVNYPQCPVISVKRVSEIAAIWTELEIEDGIKWGTRLVHRL